MKDPTVSVIIPTYNRVDMLTKAILSVLEQSYQDFEIVVVDDCSTDNTEEAVRLLGEARIKYLKLDSNSRGSFKPRSLALNVASGKYIAVLDDDGFWLNKDKLKMQVEFLDNNPEYVLVGTKAIAFNLNGEIVNYINFPTSDDSIRSKMLTRNCFHHSSVMYRKEAVEIIGGYHRLGVKPRENYTNDYELWLALGLVDKIDNLPVYSVGSIPTIRNYTFKERYRFMKSMIDLIEGYKFFYPNYAYSVICWLFAMVVDVAPLIRVKNKVVRSIANGRT